MKPDFKNDVKTYKEVKAHLLYMKDGELFLKLKTLLENYKFIIPEKKKLITGEKIKDYSNGIEYVYPETPDATITVFTNGEFKIKYITGNEYFAKNDGSYFENDSTGIELYAVFPGADQFRIRDQNYQYTKYSDSLTINNGEFDLSKYPTPIPQYNLRLIKQKLSYIFFFDEKNIIFDLALIINYSIRFDYKINEEYAMIIKNSDSIILNKVYEKNYQYFNEKTLKSENEWSPDSKNYWDITFYVSYKMNRLLDWDDVTLKSTAIYPIDEARIHYAQSYKLVSFLMVKYGKDKVDSYIKSFRVSQEDFNQKYDLKKAYKENFNKIFELSWDDNLKIFL